MHTYKFLTPHDIENFMQIDHWDYSKASFSCKMLYVFLSKFCYESKADHIVTTNKALARGLGQSMATIKQNLKRLVELGLIRSELIYDERYNRKNILCKKIYVNVGAPKHVK